MNQQQARQVLGVHEGSTVREIEEAYRALMLQHHPDRGGLPGNAQRLNEAREVLRGQADSEDEPVEEAAEEERPNKKARRLPDIRRAEKIVEDNP